MLYTGKQQCVCQAVIGVKFMFQLQSNRYINFYDDRQNNWSIMFDDDSSLSSFAQLICFAKSNTIQACQIFIQDVKFGDDSSPAVQADDVIEIKYKAWTVEDRHRLGTLFASLESDKNRNLFKVKKENEYWQKALVGMNVKGQRLVLIPLQLKDKFKSITQKVLDDQTARLIAIQFEVIRIKPKKSQKSSFSERNAEPKMELKSNLDLKKKMIDNEDQVLTKSEPESDQSDEETLKSDKSKILSKVAKLGTPTLIPMVKPSTKESESGKHDQTSSANLDLEQKLENPKAEANVSVSLSSALNSNSSNLLDISSILNQILLSLKESSNSNILGHLSSLSSSNCDILSKASTIASSSQLMCQYLNQILNIQTKNEMNSQNSQVLFKIDQTHEQINQKLNEQNIKLQNVIDVITKLVDQVSEKLTKLQNLSEIESLTNHVKLLEEKQSFLEEKKRLTQRIEELERSLNG